jgi:hypothetical protein
MDLTELEKNRNRTKMNFKQTISMHTESEHQYINDWNQSITINQTNLTMCELCNLNLKLCNTIRY